jgi:hypothetical protein
VTRPGLERVVGEVTTVPGIGVFQLTDDARPPGPYLYQIRVVEFGGRERTIGSLLCVEPGLFSPGATVTPDASQLVADPIQIIELYLPTYRALSVQDATRRVGHPRRPEPPVPRRTRSLG